MKYLLILLIILIVSCCGICSIERFEGTKGIKKENYELIKKAMKTPDVVYDLEEYNKVMNTLNNIKSDLDVYFSPTRNNILKYSVSKKIERKEFFKTMNHLKKSLDVLRPLIH